jgi:outer membrane phospholipase A
MHESNGRDGDESRSLNIVYAKPTFIFGNPQKYFTSVSPRFWFYATDPTDDPDMKDYRGYMDLVLKTGWANSLQLAGTFRVGEAFDHGSMQLDLTYPTARLFGNLDVMLHLQYFNGYGESLLRYYERSWTLRGGISLFR